MPEPTTIAGATSGRLRDDFTRSQLPGTIAAGLAFSVVSALLTITMMSLIFVGPLQDELSTGLGLGLTGTAIVGFVVALRSGFAGIYAGVQDSSAAILGLAAASVAAAVAVPQATSTVVVMLILTSVATGSVMVLMGSFRLGDVGRFVPFPVIGGLLAGTGYLIFEGGLDILLPPGGIDELAGVDGLGLFWPGVVLAALLFAASERAWSSRVYVVLLLGAVAGFHAATTVVGDLEPAARGWLLGPFPDGGLWPGLALAELGNTDWSLLAAELPRLLTILLIVPVTVLLYVGGLEIDTNTRLDGNQELVATGWGNIGAGLVGAPPGYFYMSETLIAHGLLGARRGPAIVAPFGVLALVAVGASVLELLPRFVVGGLLLFIGVRFMVDWLWSTRRRITPLDHALMAAIVVLIATVGFLAGVAGGLLAAIALFVYRYSRIDIVKHVLTGSEHRSNIERPLESTAFLDENGRAVFILELQGFVFFGTANRIVERVEEYRSTEALLRFLIIDFRLVTGVDSSAVSVFERIALDAREHGLTVLITSLKPAIRSQFSHLVKAFADVVDEHVDLDHGMAWCEEQLLALQPAPDTERSLPIEVASRLEPYLDRRAFEPGERLMGQGEPAPGIFLILSGRASVVLEPPDETPIRLRTVHEGTVLGEVSLYRSEPTTATVMADTRCEVLHLAPERFEELCRDDPVGAAELHRFVAATLAGRLSYADRTIRALHA